MIKLLDDHLKKVVFAEKLFLQCNKKSNESLVERAARILSVATHCEFGIYLQTPLGDKFIMGLQKGTVLDSLLSENNSPTIQKAFELAHATEAAVMKYGIRNQNNVDNWAAFSFTRLLIKQEINKMAIRKHNGAKPTLMQAHWDTGKKVQCTVCRKCDHLTFGCKYRKYQC